MGKTGTEKISNSHKLKDVKFGIAAISVGIVPVRKFLPIEESSNGVEDEKLKLKSIALKE